MRKKALLVLVFIGLAGLIVGQAQAQDPIKELKEWAQQLEMRFQRTRLPPDPKALTVPTPLPPTLVKPPPLQTIAPRPQDCRPDAELPNYIATRRRALEQATPVPASPNLPGTVTFKRLLTQGQIEQMRGQFGLRYVNIQYVTNAGGTGQFGYGTDTLENVEKSLQQHLGPALRIEGVVAIEVTAPPADLRRFAQQPEVLLLELAELLPLADSWYQARFQPSIWERYKRTCP